MQTPPFYDLERFRRSVNRRFWFFGLFLLLVTLGSLFLALVAFARPIPVVVFDGQGRAVLFENTKKARQTLTDVRIEYFAELFLRSFVGLDSATADEDLTRAVNMMTPAYRKAVLSDSGLLAMRHDLRNQNLRSLFSDWQVRVAPYDPEDLTEKLHVLVQGKMDFEPRVGKLEEDMNLSRWFLSELVLVRVPVTKLSIHGLQVDYCHVSYFDSRKAIEAYVHKRSRQP